MALGNWAGHWQVDADGTGGLAALQTYLEERRRMLQAEGGGLILVQSGDFSGATTIEEFTARIAPAPLNIPVHMRMDALAPARTELELARKTAGRPDWDRIPFLSLNFRLAPEEVDRTNLRPYRLVRRGNYTAFLTALTAGYEPEVNGNPIELLRRELKRQSGADVIVLLLGNEADPEKSTSQNNNNDSHDEPDGEQGDPHDENYMEADTEQKKHGPWFNSASILSSDAFRTMFADELNEPADPVSIQPASVWTDQFVIIQSGADQNHFYRLRTGPYVCAIAGRTVCEIEMRFRNHALIGLEQRFIDVNSRGRPYRHIPPDPAISRVLDR